jgi:hypothetical protein
MKRIIGLGTGGLLALVAGLVLPQLPDSAVFRPFAPPTSSTFQGVAAFCAGWLPSSRSGFGLLATVAQGHSLARACPTASDVMNLGAWLVILGAAALLVAGGALILGRIRRRPALHEDAV